MSDFLKRHKRLTLVIKSIVFLGLLAALGAFALNSYVSSQFTRVATLDGNSTGAVQSAIEAGTPVFIEACRPMCAAQLPEVEAAAAELDGRVVFFQIDPETQPELMATLSQIVGQPILTYPAHIVLAESPRLLTGAKTSAQLVDFIVQAAGLQQAPAPDATNSTSVPPIAYQNITAVTAQNIEQELAGVTTPVYILFCDGRECEIQGQLLDAVAGRFAGRIKFIQMSWFDNFEIVANIASTVQMPLAFPLHVVLSPEGGILNYAPMLLPEAQIEAFIGEALANSAAMTAAATGAQQPTVTPAPTRTSNVVPTSTPVRPDSTAGGAR